MKKITYLFGAGASAEALPIVDNFKNRMLDFINTLQHPDNRLPDDKHFDINEWCQDKSQHEYQKRLISDLNQVYVDCSKHSSPDTFAKKLYLRKEMKSYERLKLIFSLFFVYEQTLKPPDKRYDAFFASILHSLHVFPPNIRILSWNYDYQFEYAYSGFSGDSTLERNQAILKVLSKYSQNDLPKDFAIFKLNGSAMLSAKTIQILQDNLGFTKKIDKSFISFLVAWYAVATDFAEYRSPLAFAWEGISSGQVFLNRVANDIEDTEVLVVIGYSFPFFNREVDRLLIKGMKKLNKVYFQDLFPEALKERFLAIREDLEEKQLVLKKNVGQFLLPNEF